MENSSAKSGVRQRIAQGRRIARAWIALVALLLASCAMLPKVDYLQARAGVLPQDPTVITARGELSDKKTQALLDRMAARTGPTDILARHVAAEEAISGQPLIAGNKVTLLDDGPETMRAMMNAIRNARDNINLETYIFEADGVGYALAELLRQKSAAGVVVNVIYDSVGSIDTSREFFDSMRRAGIALLEYHPVNPLEAGSNWDLNQRDHRKILVVDGRIAFTGGVNISKVYGRSSVLASRRKQPTPPDTKKAAWRDTHMQIEGPAVAEFQKIFRDTWQRKTGKFMRNADYFPALKTEGQALVRAIASTPDMGDYAIYKMYISALAHADKYAHLTTAYFVPDDQMMQAMIDAARRGVDVQIVFPSFTDFTTILHAGRSHYEDLLEAGVRIYERKTAMLHAKTAVIDGVWSTIGSTNLDMRSFLHNDEINAVVLNIEFAGRMEALFQRDLQESVEITAEQWKKRGLQQRLREWAARIFAYWL
ncbi:MAG TPA: cardiolipin synthase [Noviherbaspirillum sp.]|nr:cardiolipin synthase [Noviherbaspirillum sp.]